MTSRFNRGAFGLTITLVALGSSLTAQVAVDPLVGIWQGEPKANGFQLHLALHVRRVDDRYLATLDLLDERLQKLEVDGFEFAANVVRFRVPWVGAEFVGTLVTKPEPRLQGHWLPGTGRIPTVLHQVEAVRLPRRPQDPEQPPPYRVIDIAVEHQLDNDETVTLAGTLSLPDGAGPHPAALLIAGSGYQQRDATIRGHRPFLVLADHLTRNGIAVLRYDKRGCGRSTGRLVDATSHDLAADARAVLAHLRSRDDIAADRVGLIGHSEGGMLAPMIAAGPDADRVRFVVSLAGPGVDGAAAMIHQTGLMATADGCPPADVEKLVTLQRQWLLTLQTKAADERPAAMAEAAQRVWPALSKKAQLGLGDDVANLVSRGHRLDSPWMRYFVSYDPAADLAHVGCPVLVLFGSRDVQIDPAQNLGPIERALSNGSCTDFTVREIAGLNHLFQHCTTGAASEYYEIEETMAEEVMVTIATWVRERVID